MNEHEILKPSFEDFVAQVETHPFLPKANLGKKFIA